MRLAVVLLAALLVTAVPAASHPAAERSGCAASIPDAGDEDCDGARTDQSPGDNCPAVRNADQRNTDSGYTAGAPGALDGSAKPMVDGDGNGDACDDDADADGVADERDNCRLVRNPDQLDSDGDGRGDAADGAHLCPPTDGDADGTIDEDDNCPTIANADQADTDQDRRGDVCEFDDDGDSVPDQRDNCPLAANSEQTDRDGDGVGTACDPQEIPLAETSAFAPDRTPPQVRISTAPRRGGGDVRGRLPTAAVCSEACELTATLHYRGARRASASAELGAEGRTWLFFDFRRGAINRIPRRGARATLEVVATDAAGNRASTMRRLLVRR